MLLFLQTLILSIVIISLSGNYIFGLLLGISLYGYSSIKNKEKQISGLLCVSAGLIFCVISFNLYTHRFGGEGSLIKKSYTGVITKETKKNNYNVELINEGSIILAIQSNKKLEPGDKVTVVATNVYNAEKPLIQIFGTKRSPVVYGKFVYENWLYIKGIKKHINSFSVYTEGTGKLGVLNSIHARIHKKISTVYGGNELGGLLEGMLVGGRAGLSDISYELFKKSGLVHIIAVSGSNILLVAVFFGYLLFFIPLYSRIIVILFLISCYAVMCGMDGSVFRALLFGVMGILVIFFGRKISFKRLVLYSAGILCFINPYAIWYDAGVLLSYGALTGIFVSSKILVKSRFLKNYIFPSLFAGIYVFPFLVLFFGTTNLLSRITTVFVAPFIPIILFLGVLSLYLPDSFYIYELSSLLLRTVFFLAEIGEMVRVDITFRSDIGRLLIFVITIGLLVVLYKVICSSKNEGNCYKPLEMLEKKGCGVNGSTSVSEAESTGSNPVILELIGEKYG